MVAELCPAAWEDELDERRRPGSVHGCVDVEEDSKEMRSEAVHGLEGEEQDCTCCSI